MNVNYSKARNKILERLTNEELINEWNKINWKKAEKEVHKLHSRIARSMQNNRYNDVVRLQYLLTHSFYVNALAVRYAAENIEKYKNKKLWLTNKEKMELTLELLNNPNVSRENIENQNKIKNIEIYDGVVEELYKLLYISKLKKVCKIKSFRIIKTQNSKDNCKYIKEILLDKNENKSFFKGELEEKNFINKKTDKFFIENYIIKNIIKNNNKIENKIFLIKNKNISLYIIYLIYFKDTIDSEINESNEEDLVINIKKEINKINFVWQENKFIILANNKKEIIKVQKNLKKNVIVKVDEIIKDVEDGFVFFDFSYKIKNKNLIIEPSKKSIKDFIDKLSNIILRKGKSWRQEKLIDKLNFQIKIWKENNQLVNSKKVFSKMDYVLFNLLYRWAKRRHPNKSHKWIVKKYWKTRRNSNWSFETEKNILLKIENSYQTEIYKRK